MLSDEAEAGPSKPSRRAIDDDRLRLIFTCCHPALAMEARVALTLRMVGGLTVAEIARAFLVPEATIGSAGSPARKARSRRRTSRTGSPPPRTFPAVSRLSSRSSS